MPLRFAPRAPIVWRDPTTLQIGIDRPALVLTEVTGVEERVVAAIAAGHGTGGLPTLTAHLGIDARAVATAVDRLRPALVPREAHAAAPPRVFLGGSGAMADAIGRLLASGGAEVLVGSAASGSTTGETVGPAAWGVLVGGHVVDPRLVRDWTRCGLPHLVVRAGDLGIHIGPVTVPGVTACARCLHLATAEHDGAWPAMAGQLATRTVPAPPLLSIHEAATRAARRLVSRMSDVDTAPPDAEVTTTSLDDGHVTRSTARLHPDCGCAALPRTG